MKDIRIFYFHSLDLTFKSAQTIQVIKDYYHLSNLGIKVSVYGYYQNEEDYSFIKEFVAGSKLTINAKKDNPLNKATLKVLFFLDLLKEKSIKVIVTRHYKKLSLILKLNRLGFNLKIIHEMHEESFPYLFKKISKKYVKNLFLNRDIYSFIFTNYSQVSFFKKQFGILPTKFAILPNGVESQEFSDAKMDNNFVITYLGQFNKWKNIELLFQTLSILEEKYTLRIAGGKGDKKSDLYIRDLIDKYQIKSSRVNYMGFVDNKNVADLVLNKSNALLLPLGDNIQSKFLTSPMKLFEYMSTKIPVIAINYPSVSLISSDILFLSENNPNDLAQMITNVCNRRKSDFNFKLMNNLAEKYSYGNRSRKYFQEIISEIS